MSAFEKWQVALGIVQTALLLAAFLGAFYVGLKQNEINQTLLDLHEAVSVEIAYSPDTKAIHVVNKGQTNLYLWGTRTDGNAAIEKEPRLIVPGGFYYIHADKMEAEILSKIGKNGQEFAPFEVYLTSARSKKYTAKCLFLLTVREGHLTVDTQTMGLTEGEWRTE